MSSNQGSLSSSPDPLSLCDENFLISSPVKRRRSSISPRKPLISKSGNAAVQDFFLSASALDTQKSTPTKVTKKRNTSSPWRIRLTVQADQVDEGSKICGREELLQRMREHTVVTRVPLKGSSESSPRTLPSSRARPPDSGKASTKTGSTPKRRNEKASLPPVDYSDEGDLDAQSSTPTRRPQSKSDGSTRSSWNKPSANRSRRKEISPKKLASELQRGHHKACLQSPQPDEQAVHQVSTNSVTDSLCELEGIADDYDMGNLSTSHVEGTSLSHEDEAMWRSMIRHDSLSPQSQASSSSARVVLNPTEQHQEFDSILDSEDFSMVSISSLPSAGSYSTGLPEQVEVSRHLYNSDNTEEVPEENVSMSQQVQGYSDISSIGQDCIPSSFFSAPTRQTPVESLSVFQPRAPRQVIAASAPRSLACQGDSTPKITRILRAGAKLQDIVDTEQQIADPFFHEEKSSHNGGLSDLEIQPLSTITASKTEKQDSGNPFSGFGNGTKRELRAGFRLGEELAKRRAKSPPPPAMQHMDNVNTARAITKRLQHSDIMLKQTEEPRRQIKTSQVSYPVLPHDQLPSPADTSSEVDEYERKDDTRQETRSPSVKSLSDKATASETPGLDRTLLAREAEWQLERDAVSRQIQMANSSQVIVIDDDETSCGLKTNQHEILPDVEQPKEVLVEPTHDIFLDSAVAKPRRKELPSSWRHSASSQENSTSNYSDLGLFWQLDESRAKSSRRRREGKRPLLEASQSSSKAAKETSLKRGELSDVLNHLMNNSAQSSSETSESDSEPTAEMGAVASSTSLSIEKVPDHCRTTSTMGSEVGEEVSNLADKVNRTQSPLGMNGEFLPIDPVLKQQTTLNTPILPEPSTSAQQKAQSSWFGAFTRPITSLFSSSVPEPTSLKNFPPATSSDILSSSKFIQLSSFGPWTLEHLHALEPLYYAAFLYSPSIFPYSTASPSAKHLGATVRTSLGWERKINEMDCGVTDAFMILLAERSKNCPPPAIPPSPSSSSSSSAVPTASQTQEKQKIDEALTLRICVQIWTEMIMRGDIPPLPLPRGSKIGKRKEGDRIWTEKDIRWEDCQRGYFERKKKEWGGLPSWREKGIVWSGSLI